MIGQEKLERTSMLPRRNSKGMTTGWHFKIMLLKTFNFQKISIAENHLWTIG